MSVLGSRISAEFNPPGPADFELPPFVTLGSVDVTKPMLMFVVTGVVLALFFWAAARKAEVVPGRLQFAGELVYGLVRNSIARDSIGSEKFLPFVPLLFSLFTMILVNNYIGLIPFLQFPTFSHFGFAVALAIIAWVVYIGAGMKVHGVFGYFKHQCVPSGVTGLVLLLIIPLEFLSSIIVRPITLCLRLFANMFAGHLLLMLFAFGGQYLIFEATSPINVTAGVLSFLMFFMISVLELLVMFLQAYVFTLLTAMYIGEAVAESH
ncbi:MAG: F0F1 ATP synthase subunit A [Aeromicrobium sp.]|nr:MAG: F0F1 ATP synthase subunit A [Aeromicrobium sp.]